MPLFVRGGSIIPMAPVMSYSDERPLDTLTLAVYPVPGAEGSFTLYEDDGTSLAYQNGLFSQTTFRLRPIRNHSARGLALELSPPRGSYGGPPVHRTYRIDVHRILHAPAGVTVNGTASPRRASQTGLRRHATGYWYDPSLRRLSILIPGGAGVPVQIFVNDGGTEILQKRPDQ
jgi:hypothetical protein